MVAANLGRERDELVGSLSDDLLSVEEDEQLRAAPRTLDDRVHDGALVRVRELEQPVGDGQSRRSTKTSISPPQGRPTPSASSSEMP